MQPARFAHASDVLDAFKLSRERSAERANALRA
jgi:hypothetical protein